MKKCEKCGAMMEQDALFCRECGTRLSEIDSNYVNPQLSEIIDKHWSYSQDINCDIIFTVLSLQKSPNAAIQLITRKEDGMPLQLNFCLESSTEGDSEILDKFRKSPYIKLVKPDGGEGLEEGDLSGIIDFGEDIEKAKQTISLILRDVYSQDENDSIEYFIDKNGNEIERSAGYNNNSSSGGKSCMGVIVIIVTASALVASLL